MLQKGIDRIYNEDFDSQKHYISTICENLRGRKLDILFDNQAFFVPNHEYMITYFGESITSSQYDCYHWDGNCKWTGHLVYPIRNIKGKVVGFTGYNPFTKFSKDVTEVSQLSRYKESSNILMNKSRFFICPLGVRKAIEDEYIIVVDGFFDCMSLAQEGFNAIAILGSTVSTEMRFLLSLIGTVYVAYDNDVAGVKLFNRLKLSLPKVLPIRQTKCKDIDEFIKLYPEQFKEGMKQINSKIKMPIQLKA